MRDGFIKAGAATPKVKVADVTFNRERMEEMAREAGERGVKLLVFPELAMTAYTCGDLFLQKLLLEAAKEGLKEFAAGTADLDMLIFVGLPWAQDGKLYNVAAAVKGGKVLGLVPKLHLPNYGEFYEARNFEPGNEEPVLVDWEGEKIPMGSRLLFVCRELPALQVGAEICEDLWVPCPPSTEHAMAGATVIVNCSASDETTGKSDYRRSLICRTVRQTGVRLYLRQRRGRGVQPGSGVRRPQYYCGERNMCWPSPPGSRRGCGRRIWIWNGWRARGAG